MYEQVSHSLLNSILNDLKPRNSAAKTYAILPPRRPGKFLSIPSLQSRSTHRDDFNIPDPKSCLKRCDGYIQRSAEWRSSTMDGSLDHKTGSLPEGGRLFTPMVAKNLERPASTTGIGYLQSWHQHGTSADSEKCQLAR